MQSFAPERSSPASAEKVQKPDFGEPRCVILGGFLGAGKTSCAAKLGQLARDRGLRPGFITNDFGYELVDTSWLGLSKFPLGEIKGGAFPARVESFSDAVSGLVGEKGVTFVVAESVGSAATLDGLLATSRFAQQIQMAPLSVIVDPRQALRCLQLEEGNGFSPEVRYLYRRQLHEAEFIVLNKADQVSRQQLQTLSAELKRQYPGRSLFTVSAHNGQGFDEWLECLMTREQSRSNAPLLDHDQYARAQASLSWLNCTVRLSSLKYWESEKFLTELATTIQLLLQREKAEIAHLKMSLRPDVDPDFVTTLSLTRNDAVPEILHPLEEPVQGGELILNLRAESDPETLNETANRALLTLVEAHPHLFARLEHCEYFRPGKQFEAVDAAV